MQSEGEGMERESKCLTLYYDYFSPIRGAGYFQEKKWGHLLRAGPGTKETFSRDRYTGTHTMWCWDGLGERYFLMYRYLFTLKSNAINALYHFTNKEGFFSFLFSPNPQIPSRDIIINCQNKIFT